jgi:signal transduction histidine kinase
MLSRPSGWIGRLSIGQKLAASFGVIVLLLIASFVTTLTYLSQVNSYVERHLRITIPGMIAASEMLRNIGDMQTLMHHALQDQAAHDRAAILLAVAELERKTVTTLDFYRETHAARTHPVLFEMLRHHGRIDLSEQEDQALALIAQGLTSLEAERERMSGAVTNASLGSTESAYERMATHTADAIASLIDIHRKIDVEMKIEGDRLVNQAGLIGVSLAVVLGVLIIAIYLMMQRYVALPLQRLAATADRVAHDDYTAQFAPWPGRDEVGVLTTSLSTMLTTLRDRGIALVRKTKELEAFSYSIAHDLKGPLREIEGFSSLLEKQFAESGDSQQIHHIDVIRRSSLRLTHMIDALLKYSRLEQQELPRIRFNLVEMIGGLMTQLQRQPGGVEPKITIDLPFTDLYGEPVSIRQAVGNLLDNAVKFSRHAAVPVIHIGGRQSLSEWVLWVRDNGIGFDMANKEKIFGLFERLHAPSEYEGTGVGLAIVKMVVEKHGGRVWAESTRDNGSTFYLAFPTAILNEPTSGE